MLWSKGRERKENTNLDLPFQACKCEGVHFQFPRMNWTARPFAVVVFLWPCFEFGHEKGQSVPNWVVQAVCQVFLPGSLLNCWILAPVTSNKAL